mgnify:CR=1 FL=1
MRCCRSDWPGLFVFVVLNWCVLLVDFGLFFFHKFPFYPPPPGNYNEERFMTVVPSGRPSLVVNLKNGLRWGIV